MTESKDTTNVTHESDEGSNRQRDKMSKNNRTIHVTDITDGLIRQMVKKSKHYQLVCYERNNYIEPNYISIQLPWDNPEFIKTLLWQITKRLGVSNLTYTNRNYDTEYKTTLNITDSTQQQIKRYYDVANEYRKKYYKLLEQARKNTERIKKRTAQAVLDKLAVSNQEILDHHQNSFNDIMQEMVKSYDLKIDSLTKFYTDEIKILTNNEKDLKDKNNRLQNQIIELQDQIKKGPVNSSIQQKIPKTEQSCTCSCDVKPIRKIADLEKEIVDLKTTLQRKDTQNDQLVGQVKYLKDVINDLNYQKKDLEIKIEELNRDIERSEILKVEQFKSYEKLLTNAQKEIKIHQNEAIRLREHLASPNFQGSPAFLTKKIIESKESDKNTFTPTQSNKTQQLKTRKLELTSIINTPIQTCTTLSSLSSMSTSAPPNEMLTPESSADNLQMEYEILMTSVFDLANKEKTPKKRGRPRKTPKKYVS